MCAIMLGLGLVSTDAASRAETGNEARCLRPGGIVFGLEPAEAMAVLEPAANYLGQELSARIGCPVHVLITASYSAEIEAMRAGHLDVGLFGPLGYVMAHKIAGAQAVAVFSGPSGEPATYTASIVTRAGSAIHDLAGLRGKSMAYSDPASTSGHLLPAAALKAIGVDPDHDLLARYAGSHTAAFEAIRNGQVDAAELSSITIEEVEAADEYKATDYTVLWRSPPVPNGPIAVSSSLPPVMRKAIIDALLTIRFTGSTAEKETGFRGRYLGFVAQNDAAYDGVRGLTSVIGIKTEVGR